MRKSKVSVYEKWKLPTANKVGGFSDYGTEVSERISVNIQEKDKYFYHSDHLGSTSYITDSQGNVTQHHETEERGSPTPKQIKKRRQYIPFGETFVSEYKNAGYNSPYRFNSKEFDSNTGFYYYGARYYNPKTSIWLGVDPLVEKTMQAYSFSNLNPVNYVDPDGKWPYPIYIRSFAPFKEFGGWFSGDDRGFSTSLFVTSRLMQSFIMNTDKHSYSSLKTGSSPSSHPVLGTATATDDKGSISDFKYSNNKDGSVTTSWISQMAGHNPLVIGSPNINVTTSFKLTENKKLGTLNINVLQKGDAFPSAETMISDTKGNMLMIGVSPAIGNPYTSLPGEKNDRYMMYTDFTVQMDEKGVFTGVTVGSGKDIKKYSIGDWNKILESKSPVKSDN